MAVQRQTYERLVGKVPFAYYDDAAIEIPAHGVCIDYSTIKDGKQRSIRDNTVAGTGGSWCRWYFLPRRRFRRYQSRNLKV